MNNIEREIIHKAIHEKKYDCISDISKMIHSDKSEILVTEYAGSEPRLFVDGKKPILMVPTEMTYTQESAVVDAIEKGTIFDDAETVSNSADYITKTTLPCRAMTHRGIHPPKQLKFILTGIIGVMGHDGHCHAGEPELRNGYNYIRDLTKTDLSDGKLVDMTSRYLGNDTDDIKLDSSIRREIASITDDMIKLNNITPDDEITDDDFDFIEVEDDEPTDYQEAFMSRRPKKLKPIPRDVISYIAIELNAIQDTNDQAMLSGYTCSKLELVDFYLNCIDTQDERYIVPHPRQYLITMQSQLNDLLTKILRIKPINKNDRVWQVNVNYPEGWRG